MKILISDYDNTLTRNLVVPSRNLEAVKKFREAGNLFIICSGRGFSDHRINFNDIPHDGLIASGGAYIDFESLKIVQYIDDSVTEQVTEYFFQLKTCPRFRIDAKDMPYTILDWQQEKQENIPLSSRKRPDRFTAVRILSAELADEDQAKKAKKYLDDNYGDYLASSVNHIFLDITCNGYDKLSACRKIQNLHPEAEIHTIGDGLNDLEMLMAFDGATVSNAADEVKEKVNHVYDMFADYVDYLLKQSY